jgi:hypothetical protein
MAGNKIELIHQGAEAFREDCGSREESAQSGRQFGRRLIHHPAFLAGIL